MLRYWWILLFLWGILGSEDLWAQQATGQSVFLLGNAGQITQPAQYAEKLSSLLKQHQPWTLVLSGDLLNVNSPFGEAVSQLDEFLAPLSQLKGAQIVIIPGDKDWGESKRGGLQELRRLETFLDKVDYPNVYIPLKNGCPGPYLFPIDENLKLLLINTQWINHPFTKPSSESAICELGTEEALLEEVESLIEDNGQSNVMVVGHHPMESRSRIGGFFPVHDWVLPVPVVSLFTTAFKQNIGRPEDIVNTNFNEFREVFHQMLAGQRSIVYASGHASNLEISRNEENVYVNSGAPTRGSYVRKGPHTIYASHKPGLVQIMYRTSGAVIAKSYRWERTNFEQHHESLLFQPPCLLPQKGIPVNQRLVPCLDQEEHSAPVLSHPQSLTIAANPNYALSRSATKFLGSHYRDSWTTPIHAPVLDLEHFDGGLTPIEIGGGRQTKSLKLISSRGQQYVFRSVDKDPSKALNQDLRSTIVSILVRDQTTTQQPYGAMVASALLDTLDILHARPQLYVMPHDERLGPFVTEFGGMLGMLEERPSDPDRGVSFEGSQDIKRSIRLFRQMYKDRDNQIAVDEFVRSRIFDLLVGDWGKHEDNWKWAGYKQEKGLLYRPIPRDRDHVFSLWDGLLPWIVDREWAKPSGENFDFKLKGLRSLMWQARHLDRFVASEADREAWLQQAAFIQERLSDSLIDAAIATMPSEIAMGQGKEVAAKLKSRLRDLHLYADQYYQILAKEVDVVGSNKHEKFEVQRHADGTLQVKMYKLRKRQRDVLFYNRTFKPEETKEVRLFGMDGDDIFTVEGGSPKSILLRLIPGPGRDTISDQSVTKGGNSLLLYSMDEDKILSRSEIKPGRSRDPSAYRYSRTAFTYDKYFPLAYMSFSSDYGLSLTGNITFTNQRYGKPDFSSIHELGASFSTIGNFQTYYEGIWRHIVGPLDLVGGVSFENKKRYRYFFGIGNETTYSEELLLQDYYTLQYSTFQTFLGLQRSFWKRSYLRLRSGVAFNSDQSLTNTILDDVDLFGEDKLEIGTLAFELDFDFRDRQNLPSKGARFYSYNQYAKPFDGKQDDYLVGESKIECFISVMPFTLGLRGGFLYSLQDPPYYDLPTLGQNRYLRGFRRNRFSGEDAVFVNSELRIQILDRPQALIPHKFGVRFFLDRGRMSFGQEESKTWHTGYGAGFYFVPMRERFSLHLSLAFSKEEKGLVIFGFGNSF